MISRLEPIFAHRTVLCDGAMGTSLHSRGVSIDRCCDAVNLSHPDLVGSVHEEYLLAGAKVIETNTFGANRFRLESAGLQHKVSAINRAGVRIAREAVLQFTERHPGSAWIAGSVGPLGVRIAPTGNITRDEARSAFAEQISALAEGGPGIGADFLMIETVTALNEAEQAVWAARQAVPQLPVIVMVTVDDDGKCLDGTGPEAAADRIASWGVDALGCNCGSGQSGILSAIERMAAVTSLPLVAMPSAGLPRLVNGRNVYPRSPEQMAAFAGKLIDAGAQFVGGCCGTTPQHIRSMNSALRAPAAVSSPDTHPQEATVGQF